MSYGKDSGFGVSCRLTPHVCLTKVHFRLSGEFGSSFLQILHWACLTNFSLDGKLFKLSLGTLAFTYTFPLSRPYPDFHRLAIDHAGRTKRADSCPFDRSKRVMQLLQSQQFVLCEDALCRHRHEVFLKAAVTVCF